MWYPVFDKKKIMKLLVEPNFFTVLHLVWPSKLYGLNAPAFAYSVCLWLNDWTIEYVHFSSKRSFACFHVSVWVVCHMRSICMCNYGCCEHWYAIRFDWCAYLSVCMYVCMWLCLETYSEIIHTHARTHTVSLSPLIFVCIELLLVRICRILCLCVDELPNKPNVFWNGTCIPWCSLTLETATTIKNSARLCNDSYRIPSFVRALYW